MKRMVTAALVLALCAASLAALSAEKRTIWAFQGTSAYYEEGGRIGLVAKSGKRTLVAPTLDEVRPFVKDMANARVEGLWGLMDPQGRWVVRPVSVLPIDFGPGGEYGLFSPRAGEWGFVNRRGEVVLEPAPYMDAGVMTEGLFPASDGDGYGYVSSDGKVAIGFQYDQALPFAEGLAAVEKSGKWGYINRAGEVVLPMEYEAAGSFSGGLAPVTSAGGGATVYIDGEGKAVLAGKWDWGSDFTKDKLARVRVNGKYGYINPKGHLVVAARYEDAHDFGDGMASVKRGEGNWVFVDKKGKIISNSYLDAGPYENGYAFVTYQEEGKEAVSGYVNKNRMFVCVQLK